MSLVILSKYKNTVTLLGDGLTTVGGGRIVSTTPQKVFKLNDNAIIGVVGTCAVSTFVVESLRLTIQDAHDYLTLFKQLSKIKDEICSANKDGKIQAYIVIKRKNIFKYFYLDMFCDGESMSLQICDDDELPTSIGSGSEGADLLLKTDSPSNVMIGIINSYVWVGGKMQKVSLTI